MADDASSLRAHLLDSSGAVVGPSSLYQDQKRGYESTDTETSGIGKHKLSNASDYPLVWEANLELGEKKGSSYE